MIKKLLMIAISGLVLAPVLAAAQDDTPAVYGAPESAWRVVDPENLMLIDTDYGRIGIELYPEIAPRHVAQIKTLVRRGFYDGIVFHRVINGFMNQTGDPTGTGTGDSDLPDIEAEFTFRRDTAAMPIEIIHKRNVSPRYPDRSQLGVGFHKALPVMTQPSAQSWGTKDGKVEASGIHCKGVTSMARAQSPDSANSQFFLMRTARGSSAEGLNTDYSIWGRTVMGVDLVDRIKVGVNGETPGFVPDKMNRVRIAADMDSEGQPRVKILKTQGEDYKRFLETQKKQDGTFKDICDIEIPVNIETL
jgi:peptidylprolyl isomerase